MDLTLIVHEENGPPAANLAGYAESIMEGLLRIEAESGAISDPAVSLDLGRRRILVEVVARPVG